MLPRSTSSSPSLSIRTAVICAGLLLQIGAFFVDAASIETASPAVELTAKEKNISSTSGMEGELLGKSCNRKDKVYEKHCDLYRNVLEALVRWKQNNVKTEEFNSMQLNATSGDELCKNLVSILETVNQKQEGIVVNSSALKESVCEQQCIKKDEDGNAHPQKLCQELFQKLMQLESKPVEMTTPKVAVQEVTTKTSAAQKNAKKHSKKHKKGAKKSSVDDKAVAPVVESTATVKNISATSGTEAELLDKAEQSILSSCDGKDTLYESYCDLYRNVSKALARQKQDPVKIENNMQGNTTSESQFCRNLISALETVKHKHEDIVGGHGIMKEIVCEQKCFSLDADGSVHPQKLCQELLRKLLLLLLDSQPVEASSPSALPLKMDVQETTSKSSVEQSGLTRLQEDTKKQNKKHTERKTIGNTGVETVAPVAEPVVTENDISTSNGTEGKLQGTTQPSFLSSCDGNDKLYAAYCDLYRNVSAVLVERKQDLAIEDEVNSTRFHKMNEFESVEFCMNLTIKLSKVKQKQEGIMVDPRLLKKYVCEKKCFWMDDDGNSCQRQLCQELFRKLVQLDSKAVKAQKNTQKQNKNNLEGVTKEVSAAEGTTTSTNRTEGKLQDKIKLSLPSSCKGKDKLYEKYCDLYRNLSTSLHTQKALTMRKFKSMKVNATYGFNFCKDLVSKLKEVKQKLKAIVVDTSLLNELPCEQKCFSIDDDGNGHLKPLCQGLLWGFRELLRFDSKGKKNNDDQREISSTGETNDNGDLVFDNENSANGDSELSSHQSKSKDLNKKLSELPEHSKYKLPAPVESNPNGEVQWKKLSEDDSLKQSDSIYFAFCIFTMFVCISWFVVHQRKSKPSKYT